MHFFIIDNAFITSTLSLKKISQINQMNRQNVLSDIPIDKHIGLTSKVKHIKKDNESIIYLWCLVSVMKSII